MEISIFLLTYNHERFVRQALESILMQKIAVSYEIIILDDASTDHTPEILREYKKRYPQKISLYLRKRNTGHPTKNGYFLLSKAKGRYYTCLEGDDYWIDKLKIQKQYDFLEQHKEYSGCMTDLIVVDEENRKIEKQVYEKREHHIYTLDDFRYLRAPGMTVTFFARNYFEQEMYRIIYRADGMMGDITSYMLCLIKGDIYQLDEVMAAYRYIAVSGKSNFNSIHQENIYRDYMQVRYWLRLENFMRRYRRGFEFAPMANIIGKISEEYPMKVVLHLLVQSENRKKYVFIYFIYKLLMGSSYLREEVRGNEKENKYKWNHFKNERMPIILFGSGAVAAEYLDKYAWKGNILFLVDNDTKKQDTSFKGFLIKRPEEILRYKYKAKVLITNQEHELDIEKQLMEMGIQSYYCYCSMQTVRIRNRVAKQFLNMCGVEKT